MRSHLVAIAVAAALALLLPPSQACADIYRYVDDSGVIHFSNIPEDRQSERVVKESLHARTTVPSPSFTTVPEKKKAEDSVTTGVVDAAGDSPVDGPFADIINAKCDKYDVDPTLVKAIIKAESGFNPRAVSPKGARGLMQLMPSTAEYMGVYDSFDPEQNIEGGVKYFRYLLDNFGGDVELSVAAYNCGEGRVIRNGNCVPEIAETKDYVRKVMKYSSDPVTGMQYTKTIYRIELKDGSVLFSDRPVPASLGLSIVE